MKLSNFKEWLWSAKVLTTIVWILFPLSYITVTAFLHVPGTLTEPITIDTIHTPHAIYTILGPPLPLVIVLALFAIIPAIEPSQGFFRIRGYANAVIEYTYIKKILYGFIITLIIVILSFYYLSNLVNTIIT